jgi:SWI/SNF-related matrix-associated actin-dependent regulator 1 of chromatin subfamily A
MPTLRPFQREDVDFLKKNKLRALVASAPGTGKTCVSIRALVETKATFPALIICPSTVTRNWEKEINKWAKGLRVVIIEDMDTRIRLRAGPPTFFVISWALLDPRLHDLKKLKLQSIIADEAHYSKNTASQRSMALHELSKEAKHLLLLTGTPIVNNKAELAVLHDLIGTEKPPMIRRLLEDVAPDIPPKSRSYLNIKLRPADQQEYNRANEEFETWLKDRKTKLLGEGVAQAEVERTLAAEALAKIGYLRRILGEAKVPACSDFIARAIRMGEPVVCFVEHQGALERLSRALNKQRIRHEIIDGSTTPKKRQEIVERFQKYEFPVFIGTRAAKEGITLTAARHLIFLERFFTAADEEQAEDRVRRIGQVLPTTIWFLHAFGTVDERVDQIVKQKRQLVRSAIGSETIEETPLLAVEEMIKNWQAKIDETGVQFAGLGLGTILPALPSPKETHAITFSGSEWHLQKALLWCKMNGYIPSSKTDLQGRFKLVVHPPHVFNKNKFKIFSVSKDIKIIHGERLSKANERRIRNQLRGMR